MQQSLEERVHRKSTDVRRICTVVKEKVEEEALQQHQRVFVRLLKSSWIENTENVETQNIRKEEGVFCAIPSQFLGVQMSWTPI